MFGTSREERKRETGKHFVLVLLTNRRTKEMDKRTYDRVENFEKSIILSPFHNSFFLKDVGSKSVLTE